jgi:hydroxymethylpyrimidine/phosphomethylpyrimidine kinase
MIGSAQTAHAVADYLSSSFRRRPESVGVEVQHQNGPGLRRGDELPIVFDPVMVATSGATLADPPTIAAFQKLMALATLTTPNLPELEALGGEGAMHGATLIKGGHGTGDIIIDRLIGPDGELALWEGRRIDTTSTHGTGCTLASAIACGMGQGMTLQAAIERARLFVRAALEAAPGLGQGHGPMGHQSVRLQ